MIDEEVEFKYIDSDNVAATEQEDEEEFAKIMKFGDFEDSGEEEEGHGTFDNNF